MHAAISLALLLASAGCRAPEPVTPESPSPASPAAPAPAPAPAEAYDFNLPALEPDPSYVATGTEGPPPIAYRLPDGRVLIHDRNQDQIAVLDPATKQRTELGLALLSPVPRLGWFIVPKGDGPTRYYDVEPGAARLRMLWEVPRAKDGERLEIGLAGVDRGAPLFMLRRYGRTTGQAEVGEPRVELVRLRGGAGPEVRSVELRAGLKAASADAIRGAKVLLIEGDPARSRRYGTPGWDTPFSADVFLFDLETGVLRPLGKANGDWSHSSAVPHPYVAVRWNDHDIRTRENWFGAGCVNVVDVATEQLTPCAPGSG